MVTVVDFIRSRYEKILAGYIEKICAQIPRYSRVDRHALEIAGRRLIWLMPTADQDPHSRELQDYVDDLCRQRLPMGFQLGDIMAAIYLYSDTLAPLVLEVEGDEHDRLELYMAVQHAVQNLALAFSETFVSLQMDVLEKQRKAVLELSTPVIKVWDGILALPLIGTIDSYRAKQVMEDLLREVAQEQADIVLLDITGVPVVDTNVADHLIRTIRAAEMLGTTCLLVGIGPDLSQTVVSLGVDLSHITSCADMRQGLTVAFQRLGLDVVPKSALAALNAAPKTTRGAAPKAQTE